MSGPGFAVIDFETTGLFPARHDRVVELAVVHVNDNGRITGQWETLVNPMREVGATHIHGIRGDDVMHAPTFAEIAPHLVELLDGRVLVAHNASFDLGFLRSELQYAGYALTPELLSAKLCTMQLAKTYLPGARRSLADCCAAFDIELEEAHRASVDAFATAQLLAGYMEASGSLELWDPYIDQAFENRWPNWPGEPVTTPRHELWTPRASSAPVDPRRFLARITQNLPEYAGPAEYQDYLALLDRCIIDHHLASHEADELVRVANELGISRASCQQLHQVYFEELARVAWADAALTSDDIADLGAVGALLALPPSIVAAAFVQPTAAEIAPARHLGAYAADPHSPLSPAAAGSFRLYPGDQIVLSGELSRPREEWQRDLFKRGFVPKPAISKKVKLVVAADPDSLSGKARKAREYGIPVVGEDGLMGLLGAR